MSTRAHVPARFSDQHVNALMWTKVDDKFPDHVKVFAAGEHLGKFATGRVIAIWVEAMAYTNGNNTNGYIPAGVARTFKHDRQPLKVMDAMTQPVQFPDGTVHAGLFAPAAGGYQVHDYGDYNDPEKFKATSAARAAAGRLGGLKSAETKRAARQNQLPKQTASNCYSNMTANRNPDPDPDLQEHEEHRAEGGAGCGKGVEKTAEPGPGLSRVERRVIAQQSFLDKTDRQQHQQLCAVVSKELDAGHVTREAVGGVEGMEHLKTVMARACLPVQHSGQIRAAIDNVIGARDRKARQG